VWKCPARGWGRAGRQNTQEPSRTLCHPSPIPWACLGVGVGTGLCPPPSLGQTACSLSIPSVLPTF